MNELPETKEKHLSQIPALQVLITLGCEYLTPEEALSERSGKVGNVPRTGSDRR